MKQATWFNLSHQQQHASLLAMYVGKALRDSRDSHEDETEAEQMNQVIAQAAYDFITLVDSCQEDLEAQTVLSDLVDSVPDEFAVPGTVRS